MPRVLWWLPALLLTSGCGSLDVAFTGELPLEAGVLEAAGSSPEEPLVLAFTRRGQLTVNGELLELPSAREQTFTGVTLVDTTALPPPWRPPHAPAGGLVVSGLAKGSPLAIAGLRLFDRIDAIDGEPLARLADLPERLGDRERHRLQVTKPSGEAVSFEVQAEDAVGDSTVNHVPFLFERRSAPTGHALGVGPLDGLFYYRARKTLRYVHDPTMAHAAYRDRFEWGALLNLLRYASETDPRTGETLWQVRLLWFIPIGDDL